MSKVIEKWFPVTPGGTVVRWLGCDTPEQAWRALLHDASHMPYKDKAAFQARGYRVEKHPASMIAPAPAYYKV